MILPVDDQRPFDAVLSDWVAAHFASDVAAGDVLGTTRQSINSWKRGAACQHETAYRAAMSFYVVKKLMSGAMWVTPFPYQG